MGATSRVISGSIDNFVDFIKSVANKIDGPTDFAEGKGALGNLPYVQLGEPVFEGGRRVVPGSRAEVVVPSGDMNPKLFNAIQSQKREADEIIRDIEGIPAQENRSPQMIRQDILDSTGSYVVSHSLNENYPVVTVWETGSEGAAVVVPESIISNNDNTVTVNFADAFNGHIIVKV